MKSKKTRSQKVTPVSIDKNYNYFKSPIAEKQLFFFTKRLREKEFTFMQSSKFGPAGHKFLFHVAAGYDLNEAPKHVKDEQYKIFFEALGNVLPCKYCRESYHKFYQYLNIQRYLDAGQCGLVKFYYDMRQMINRKLEIQEEAALKEEYEKLLQQGKQPDDATFWAEMREKSQRICYTKPAPPFEKVVNDLLQERAGCSAKMKTCREPLHSPSFPTTSSFDFKTLPLSTTTDTIAYQQGGGRARRRSTSRSAGVKRSGTKRTKSFGRRKSLRRKIKGSRR